LRWQCREIKPSNRALRLSQSKRNRSRRRLQSWKKRSAPLNLGVVLQHRKRKRHDERAEKHDTRRASQRISRGKTEIERRVKCLPTHIYQKENLAWLRSPSQRYSMRGMRSSRSRLRASAQAICTSSTAACRERWRESRSVTRWSALWKKSARRSRM